MAKWVYRPEEIENMKQSVLVRVDKAYRNNSDLLYGLKGKHREAMFAAVEIENARTEKKFEAALKNSISTKRWEKVKKIVRAHKARLDKANKTTIKALDKFLASEGLTQIQGMYVPATTAEGQPYITWYMFDHVDAHNNPFLAKELFELSESAKKSLYEMKNRLIAIQETGTAKPKPVNFPQPIREELEKFEVKGLLTAGK